MKAEVTLKSQKVSKRRGVNRVKTSALSANQQIEKSLAESANKNHARLSDDDIDDDVDVDDDNVGTLVPHSPIRLAPEPVGVIGRCVTNNMLRAVSHGQLSKVKYLVRQDAKINVKDAQGHSLLMLALSIEDEKRRDEMFRYLLEQEALHLEAQDVRTHRNVLCWAAYLGRLTQLRQILTVAKGELNLNHKDFQGRTALHLAVIQGHVKVVRKLATVQQKYGLSLDEEDEKGMTPLLSAARMGQPEIVEVLGAAGASTSRCDSIKLLTAHQWSVVGEREREKEARQQRHLMNVRRKVSGLVLPSVESGSRRTRKMAPRELRQAGQNNGESNGSCRLVDENIGSRTSNYSSLSYDGGQLDRCSSCGRGVVVIVTSDSSCCSDNSGPNACSSSSSSSIRGEERDLAGASGNGETDLWNSRQFDENAGIDNTARDENNNSDYTKGESSVRMSPTSSPNDQRTTQLQKLNNNHCNGRQTPNPPVDVNNPTSDGLLRLRKKSSTQESERQKAERSVKFCDRDVKRLEHQSNQTAQNKSGRERGGKLSPAGRTYKNRSQLVAPSDEDISRTDLKGILTQNSRSESSSPTEESVNAYKSSCFITEPGEICCRKSETRGNSVEKPPRGGVENLRGTEAEPRGTEAEPRGTEAEPRGTEAERVYTGSTSSVLPRNSNSDTGEENKKKCFVKLERGVEGQDLIRYQIGADERKSRNVSSTVNHSMVNRPMVNHSMVNHPMINHPMVRGTQRSARNVNEGGVRVLCERCACGWGEERQVREKPTEEDNYDVTNDVSRMTTLLRIKSEQMTSSYLPPVHERSISARSRSTYTTLASFCDESDEVGTGTACSLSLGGVTPSLSPLSPSFAFPFPLRFSPPLSLSPSLSSPPSCPRSS